MKSLILNKTRKNWHDSKTGTRNQQQIMKEEHELKWTVLRFRPFYRNENEHTQSKTKRYKWNNIRNKKTKWLLKYLSMTNKTNKNCWYFPFSWESNNLKVRTAWILYKKFVTEPKSTEKIKQKQFNEHWVETIASPKPFSTVEFSPLPICQRLFLSASHSKQNNNKLTRPKQTIESSSWTFFHQI